MSTSASTCSTIKKEQSRPLLAAEAESQPRQETFDLQELPFLHQIPFFDVEYDESNLNNENDDKVENTKKWNRPHVPALCLNSQPSDIEDGGLKNSITQTDSALLRTSSSISASSSFRIAKTPKGQRRWSYCTKNSRMWLSWLFHVLCWPQEDEISQDEHQDPQTRSRLLYRHRLCVCTTLAVLGGLMLFFFLLAWISSDTYTTLEIPRYRNCTALDLGGIFYTPNGTPYPKIFSPDTFSLYSNPNTFVVYECLEEERYNIIYKNSQAVALGYQESSVDFSHRPFSTFAVLYQPEFFTSSTSPQSTQMYLPSTTWPIVVSEKPMHSSTHVRVDGWYFVYYFASFMMLVVFCMWTMKRVRAVGCPKGNTRGG